MHNFAMNNVYLYERVAAFTKNYGFYQNSLWLYGQPVYKKMLNLAVNNAKVQTLHAWCIDAWKLEEKDWAGLLESKPSHKRLQAKVKKNILWQL